jgi:hypothetical protein
VAAFHKLDKEINSTTQGLILANTEAERIKKRGSFMEKYGTQLLMFMAIIILAIAIFQESSNIAGLKIDISQLGGAVTNLSGLLPKIGASTGLPAT